MAATMLQEESEEELLRCRVCLEADVSEMISVFCVASTQKKLLTHMTLAVAGVPISMCDKMPQVICDKCLGNLDIAYACWRRCRESWGEYVRDPALQDKEEDYRCRICLRSNVEELISLYCICDSQLLKINEMVKQYAGVEVKEDDGRPQYTCDGCLSELNVGFEFRKLCRQSNVKLRCELQAKETTAETPLVESDYESLPEADRDNQTPEPPPKPLKKIAKRRQSVKMLAKPELPAKAVRITKSDIPEVVPGSFKSKKKVFSSPSEFKQLTSQILNKPKQPSPVKASANAKKKTFSSPSEFKQLANKIMTKTSSFASATLVAFEIRVLTDSEHYTHSEVSSFKCSRCNSRNLLETIDVTCVKCCSPFDNYLLVRPHKGQPSMKAFCCTECNYFAKTLSSMVNHLGQHLPVVPVGKTKTLVMKNLNIPVMPIAMKEESVEVPENDEAVPDPLEAVFVPGTLKRASAPAPTVQSKKPRKVPSADTMDVLIELNQSEPESASDASSPRPDQPMDHLFDTLLEADTFNVLLLKGAICCGCSKLFPSQDVLRQHQARDHALNASFDEDEITCDTCTERCASDRDLGLHQQLATKKIFYFCKACPRLLIDEQDFESHRTECHPALVVKAVARTNNLLVTKAVPSGSRKHWTAPLKLSSGDPTIFKTLKETAQYRLLLLQGEICCNCLLVHPTLESLRKHLTAEHPPTQVFARYKCYRCFENCRSEAKLTTHRLQGMRRLYYACKLCRGRLLESDEDFETHRVKCHPRLEVMANGLPLAQTSLLVEIGGADVGVVFN
uniref:ZAD domain-containing protein n=1 Tax=Culex tarsalis TaxID=7177 RepID=A0A1Q3EYQ7_CULTA